MQQVLFTIPLFKGSFPPDGIPVYGFGAMLFLTFLVVIVWGSRRAKPIGMPAERFQDFAIWVFVAGIIGARVLYMIQYSHQFNDKSLSGLAGAFFKIWEGGIIFYGSALGGVIGYGLFYWFVMRRLNVSGWKLADAVAPLLAAGLAIGRIGCYLNGCCWGQVACEEVAPVPLGAAHFPLLPAHARGQLVNERHLQTTTGFAGVERGPEQRFEVTAVEVGSPADRAGVKKGDQIISVNGQAVTAQQLDNMARNWPRGQSRLTLVVERADGTQAELPPFAPRTIGLYPTQLYETVSMVLLILVLLAFYPYRRHDGQLMVLLMIGYAIHRFVNESLRVEPVIEGTPFTLSQWGSVVILAAALAIEAYLWRVMPSRWKG